MSEFVIKQLPYNLSSQAGLALVSKYLRRINLNALVDPIFPVRWGIANSAILKSYLALLCQGKSDFDAIQAHRADSFFARALNLTAVPSSPTLRQRMDAQASAWFELSGRINEALLSMRINGQAVDFGSLPCGYTPLDVDTFAMDNGDTAKKLMGRTYAWVDGYCPIASYLGTAGFCLELALRPGVQHSARESEYDLQRVLPIATRLVSGPLLVRADSGFCSQALMRTIAEQGRLLERDVAFLIKWNPRSTPIERMAAQKGADADTLWCHLRAGKRQCVWEETIGIDALSTNTVADADQVPEQQSHVVRRIYRLTERVLDKHGQPMLLPEYILEGWTTTLPAKLSAGKVIALYADHATHEQYHREFKTDLDLERLPSGKFDTNYLICQLAAVAMNLLRLIGQQTPLGKDAPIRHKAKRRRIKTVMQEMIYKAGRMMHHAGQYLIGLGANDPGFAVFERHYRCLASD
ncbi:MAG: IS1380 family transposase [Ottowia sp.]|nr:IS1380 family transposase [Ottowia sp.]